MNKITFEEFCSVMSFDITNNRTCIEIEFCIDSYEDYQCSWLGKMLYDKDAKVFHGKSIKEIWDLVTILSIDACNIEERLPFYLGLE